MKTFVGTVSCQFFLQELAILNKDLTVTMNCRWCPTGWSNQSWCRLRAGKSFPSTNCVKGGQKNSWSGSGFIDKTNHSA